MKIFKLVGEVRWPQKGKDYIVLLGADGGVTEDDFRKVCRKVAQELKVKHKADDPNAAIVKTREEIIDEIALLVCKRLGLRRVEIAGEHIIGGFPR